MAACRSTLPTGLIFRSPGSRKRIDVLVLRGNRRQNHVLHCRWDIVHGRIGLSIHRPAAVVGERIGG